jgi:hypothetical protein
MNSKIKLPIDLIMLTSAGKSQLCKFTLSTWIENFSVQKIIIASNNIEKLGKELPNEIEYVVGEKFGNRFRNALSKCISQYVLVILDDYYLHFVNQEEFKKINTLLKSLSPFAIKLSKSSAVRTSIFIPSFKNFVVLSNTGIGLLDTHPTIYNVIKLEKIIDPKESLWEHEVNHSIRAIMKNYSVISHSNKILNYTEIVKAGKLWWSYRQYRFDTQLKFMPLHQEIKIKLVSMFKSTLIKIFGYDTLMKIRGKL